MVIKNLKRERSNQSLSEETESFSVKITMEQYASYKIIEDFPTLERGRMIAGVDSCRMIEENCYIQHILHVVP